MKKSLLALSLGAALLPLAAAAQSAKPGVKPAAKPALRPAATVGAKPVAKPTATAVAKPATAVAKPATSPGAKPAAPTITVSAGRSDSITGTAPVGVSLSPATPPASPTALKVKAELNPVTNRLSVRTDAAGPTRIEVNDGGGRPVLTKNVLVGNKSVELNVGQLPAGTYVVRCTAGEKTGMRLVRLGQ